MRMNLTPYCRAKSSNTKRGYKSQKKKRGVTTRNVEVQYFYRVREIE